MRLVNKLAGFGVLGLAIAGCGGSNTTTVGAPSYGGDMLNNDQRQQVATAATKALNNGDATKYTAGVNAFGFDLFKKVVANSPKVSACVSPVSVGAVLAMLYNGADGETKKELSHALGVAKLSPDQLNDAGKNLNALLANVDPDKVTLDISNSLWVDAGVPLSPDFVQKNQATFDAKVSTLDFRSTDAPKTINDWVKDKTKGKIPSIVEKVPNDARLYVINAVYFKGLWSQPFKKENTHDGTFTLSDGTKETVPMMSQTQTFGYFSNGDVTGLTMPYGSGRLEMDVLVPSKDVATVLKKLDAGTWADWMKNVNKRSVEVTLPKFTSEFQANLNDALKALGMSDAFSPIKANFTQIEAKGGAVPAGEKLYLSEVKHKTFVDVNEEGTEAAAVTSGEVRATAMMMPTRFMADRPFIYAVRDTQTGAILFLGTMLDPKVAPAPATDASPPAKDSSKPKS